MNRRQLLLSTLALAVAPEVQAEDFARARYQASEFLITGVTWRFTFSNGARMTSFHAFLEALGKAADWAMHARERGFAADALAITKIERRAPGWNSPWEERFNSTSDCP
jgi:hypothetical protein